MNSLLLIHGVTLINCLIMCIKSILLIISKITYCRCFSVDNFKLLIINIPLMQVTCVNFVGIHFDAFLSWKYINNTTFILYRNIAVMTNYII